jgi:hypothetical protein
MIPLLLGVLLQASQTVTGPDLPVSLDRVRAGLARPAVFELSPPSPWRRPLFRMRIEEQRHDIDFDAPVWQERGIVPPWVRPHRPTYHYDFLSRVTPEEVRGPTLHPCCNVTPILEKVSDVLANGVRTIKKARARREVERVMRDAGIKKD